MKAAKDMPEAVQYHAGIILTERTVAALSQLDQTESDAVLDTIEALKGHELNKESGLAVERLSGSMDTYAVRVQTPSDLRLIIREGTDGSLVVLSVFRAEALRGLFHAS